MVINNMEWLGKPNTATIIMLLRNIKAELESINIKLDGQPVVQPASGAVKRGRPTGKKDSKARMKEDYPRVTSGRKLVLAFFKAHEAGHVGEILRWI